MGDSTYTMWSQLQARQKDSKKYWQETAEGLACELDSAIAVMARRAWGGADVESMGEWLVLNFGKHKTVMERYKAARAAHIAGLKEALTIAHIAGLKEALTIVNAMRQTIETEAVAGFIRSRIKDLEGQDNG